MTARHALLVVLIAAALALAVLIATDQPTATDRWTPATAPDAPPVIAHLEDTNG